jgi:hypothetical protein
LAAARKWKRSVANKLQGVSLAYDVVKKSEVNPKRTLAPPLRYMAVQLKCQPWQVGWKPGIKQISAATLLNLLAFIPT